VTSIAGFDNLSISDEYQSGLAQFVGVTIDPTQSTNRKFVAHITAHWMDVVRSNFGPDLDNEVSTQNTSNTVRGYSNG
jgi:hypothetical protein